MRAAFIHYGQYGVDRGAFCSVSTTIRTNPKTGKDYVDCRTEDGSSHGWRLVRRCVNLANVPILFCIVDGGSARVTYDDSAAVLPE